MTADSPWFERCDNPEAVRALYDSGEGLDRVRLVELRLGQHDPHLWLRVELPRFPDRPPARWHPEATVAQATVAFWFVEEVRLEGWSGDAEGTLSLVRADGGLRMAFESGAMRLAARCLGARVDGFGAHAVWPPDDAGGGIA